MQVWCFLCMGGGVSLFRLLVLVFVFFFFLYFWVVLLVCFFFYWAMWVNNDSISLFSNSWYTRCFFSDQETIYRGALLYRCLFCFVFLKFVNFKNVLHPCWHVYKCVGLTHTRKKYLEKNYRWHCKAIRDLCLWLNGDSLHLQIAVKLVLFGTRWR